MKQMHKITVFAIAIFFCLRLILLEGGPGSPSCLLGGKHNVSWGFEDMLPTPDCSAAGTESKGRTASGIALIG